MLTDVLNTLKSHESALKQKGVIHAAVFGSTVRGEETDASDVDVLIDLDDSRPMTVFDYAAIKDMIGDLLGGRADVVTREGLKDALRQRVEQEAVDAF
jgi:predicted nucleotidyltransferase